MLGVAKPEDVAGVFQQGVLEPAARSQEGAIGLPREPNSRQGPLLIFVRAGWHTPEHREGRELLRRVPPERSSVWTQVGSRVRPTLWAANRSATGIAW